MSCLKNENILQVNDIPIEVICCDFKMPRMLLGATCAWYNFTIQSEIHPRRRFGNYLKEFRENKRCFMKCRLRGNYSALC